MRVAVHPSSPDKRMVVQFGIGTVFVSARRGFNAIAECNQYIRERSTVRGKNPETV